MTQLLALGVVAIVVAVAVALERAWAWRGRRAALQSEGVVARGAPYVLYFTGPNCTICHTHQEPALERLEDVIVDKVDAIERADLAEKFRVYTVPTTVVIDAAGRPAAVNYGYAPAEKLRKQLDLARLLEIAS